MSSPGSPPGGPNKASQFRIASLILPIYLPTLLFAVGQGLVIPVVPIFARDLGASLAIAGLVVTVQGIGSMVTDVPAGVLVSRFGGRIALTAGALGTAVAAVAAGLSGSTLHLGVALFFAGGTFALWQVSRLSHMSDTVPNEVRGRALSIIGGVNRIGMFIGPFAGGLIGRFAGLEAVFFVQAVLAASAGALVFTGMRGEVRYAAPVHEAPAVARVRQTLTTHWYSFATAGLVAVSLVLVRHARRFIFPLWGDSIGLGVDAVGLVLSIASAVDMLLFLPVGAVMDRFGRKFTIVPCLLILASSLALIPLVGGLPAFIAVGALSGFGNGLGTGAVMTLGSDLAPREHSGEFLGVWRLITDVGAASAPSAVGGLAEVMTLGVASVAMGGVGYIGAALMIAFVAETLRREPSADASQVR